MAAREICKQTQGRPQKVRTIAVFMVMLGPARFIFQHCEPAFRGEEDERAHRYVGKGSSSHDYP